MIRLNNSKTSTLVPSKHENREMKAHMSKKEKGKRKHTYTHTCKQKIKNKIKEIMHIEKQIYSIKSEEKLTALLSGANLQSYPSNYTYYHNCLIDTATSS